MGFQDLCLWLMVHERPLLLQLQIRRILCIAEVTTYMCWLGGGAIFKNSIS